MKLKNIFYALSLVFALGTFTVCDDDDEIAIDNSNPEEEVAGTYVGTWTRTAGTGTPETVPGTVTVTAGERYLATVAWTCEATTWTEADANTGLVMNPNGLSSGVNVLPEVVDGTIVLYNGSTTNGFTTTFEASVVKDPDTGAQTMTFDYSWSIQSGRVPVTYAFVFTGTKQ